MEYLANQQDYGVLSGICITLDATDMTYDNAAGHALVNGKIVAVCAGTDVETLSAPVCNPKVVRWRVNACGTVSTVEGCEACPPLPPDIGGDCFTPLYEATLTVGQTQLNSSTNQIVQGPIIRHTGWKGSDITSTACIAYPAGGGTYFDVTGSNCISSLPDAPAGTRLTLQFDSVLKINHNDCSLIMADAQTFTTQGGDVLEFMSEGCGNWREINRPSVTTRRVVKNATTTISSDDTLTTDCDLSIPVSANTTYAIRGYLEVCSCSTADFKVRWSTPSGNVRTLFFVDTCCQIACVRNGGCGVTLATNGAETITFQGFAQPGLSGGCLALDWAQGTSNASCTSLGGLSHLIIEQLC